MGDDGTHPIGVEVDDGTGTATHSTNVTITNAEPTITVTGAPAVAVGDPYRVVVDVADPGEDTVTSWTISWGDGEHTTGTSEPIVASHTYAVAGLHHGITVEVTDEDGTWIPADLVVPLFDTTEGVARINSVTGIKTADLASTSGALDAPYTAIVGPDGLIYVTGFSSDNVVRFDPDDNSYVDEFVAAGLAGLSGPKGLAFGPDGDLYVASAGTSEVLRYDPDGSFDSIFVASGTLSSPGPLLFAPDGTLLVGDQVNDDIEQYDATTGTSIGVFATLGPGGMPTGLAVGPTGNIFVTRFSDGQVEELDGMTGASLGIFASGLNQAHSLSFGPDGDLWVSDYWVEEIVRFDGATGTALGTRSTLTPPAGPFGFTWIPDLGVQVTAGLEVNSSADDDDAVPGNGTCNTGGLNAIGQPECTLRAAITEANAGGTPASISFDLPVADAGHGSGVWTIAPATPLPVISVPVSIDGTTQAGMTAATTPFPSPIDSSLTIQLSGSAMAAGSEGLDLDTGSDRSLIRGLALTGFAGTGAHAIRIGNTSGVGVVGNHLGVSASGLAEAPNEEGVRIGGGAVDAQIGGVLPADRNLFGGHDLRHIGVVGGAAGSVIEGNELGFLAGGVNATTGPTAGISAWHGSTGTVIGGADPAAGNRIRGATTGIGVEAGTVDAFASIVGNHIWDNSALGIDINGDGVTPNDANDSDSGPNDVLNHPAPTGASLTAGTVDLAFDLDAPAGGYRIEVFTNPNGTDPSGSGEAELLAGQASIVHPGGGSASFTVAVPGAAGDELTLSATEIVGATRFRSTSELSGGSHGCPRRLCRGRRRLRRPLRSLRGCRHRRRLQSGHQPWARHRRRHHPELPRQRRRRRRGGDGSRERRPQRRRPPPRRHRHRLGRPTRLPRPADGRFHRQRWR